MPMHYLFFLILVFHMFPLNSAFNEDHFSFFGFNNSNLILDGVATVTSNGLLDLTNNSKHAKGHAFYPIPLKLQSPCNKILSFSTTFVFAILSRYQDISGHGLAFVLSPTTNFSSSLAAQYLGLFNNQNNGKKDNRFLAIELSSYYRFPEYNDNHVWIDTNSLVSDRTEKAGYYDVNTGSFKELNPKSGMPVQVWVDFDGQAIELNVSMSSSLDHKPAKPLISSVIDRSSFMPDSMYAGFSSWTGSLPTSHYILGWSFRLNGTAKALGRLSFLPWQAPKTKNGSNSLPVWSAVSQSKLAVLTPDHHNQIIVALKTMRLLN